MNPYLKSTLAALVLANALFVAWTFATLLLGGTAVYAEPSPAIAAAELFLAVLPAALAIHAIKEACTQ